MSELTWCSRCGGYTKSLVGFTIEEEIKNWLPRIGGNRKARITDTSCVLCYTFKGSIIEEIPVEGEAK